MPLQRAGDGSPRLLPAGATDERARVLYTRASSLADWIADSKYLHSWEMRYLARGMGISPDLCRLAAVEPYHTGLDPLPYDVKRESAANLDGIIERALDRVMIHEKADYGSAVHRATEPAVRALGADVPPECKPDVDSFFATLERKGIRIGATETFTACDETRSAGTFDHLVWTKRFGVTIADKKTGKMSPQEFCVQLATYAHGELYDVDTDQRAPLESLTQGKEVNRDVGLIFWIHGGRTKVKVIDLAAGWEAAKRAAWVRDWHARSDLMADF